MAGLQKGEENLDHLGNMLVDFSLKLPAGYVVDDYDDADADGDIDDNNDGPEFQAYGDYLMDFSATRDAHVFLLW